MLTKKGDPKSAKFILGATTTEKGKKLHLMEPAGKISEISPSNITLDPNTGRLEFESDGDTYNVREPRDNDGVWASKYGTSLPVEALPAFVSQGASDQVDPQESLVAYAPDDGAYVVGLTYTNDMGTWARNQGDWSLMAPDDDSYDQMQAIEIDPEKADDFLNFYDKNYTTVDDAQQYKSADSDSDFEPDDDEGADGSVDSGTDLPQEDVPAALPDDSDASSESDEPLPDVPDDSSDIQ